MEEERVREKVAEELYYQHFLDRYRDKATRWQSQTDSYREMYYKDADQILAIKLGNRTLREWIELYEQGKLEIRAEDQSLPENPYVTLDSDGRIYGYDPDKANAYGGAQEDMGQEGFVKVLKKE